jgi:hypothetical protein
MKFNKFNIEPVCSCLNKKAQIGKIGRDELYNVASSAACGSYPIF